MFLVDSHCHLDFFSLDREKKNNFYSILDESLKNNIKYILSVSVDIFDFFYMMDLVVKNKSAVTIGLSCGIHPLNVKKNFNFLNLYELISKNEVLAVGETGLDYSRKFDNDHIELQKIFFREHIRAASFYKKPIIIHMRNSFEDTLSILKEESANVRYGGILHCFTGDLNIASILLDMGFYISFSGILTFDNSENIRDVAKSIPLNSILVETDSPYLSPFPYRYKINKPSNLVYIIQLLAKLKSLDFCEISLATTKNFFRLMKIDNKFI